MTSIKQLLIGALIAVAGIYTTSCSEAPPAPVATSLSINISGMTCAGCSNAITETLTTMPGVTSVEVDHEAGVASIVTDGTPQLPEKIVSTINELGFTATSP